MTRLERGRGETHERQDEVDFSKHFFFLNWSEKIKYFFFLVIFCLFSHPTFFFNNQFHFGGDHQTPPYRTVLFCLFFHKFPCGVVGNTVGFHPATPGSIPGKGAFFFFFTFNILWNHSTTHTHHTMCMEVVGQKLVLFFEVIVCSFVFSIKNGVSVCGSRKPRKI